MSKYYVTGGLAGPWKKKKVDNLEPVYIDFDVTTGDPPTVTTETTFEDVCDFINKGRTIIARGHQGIFEHRIPLTSIVNTADGEISDIIFSGFVDIADEAGGGIAKARIVMSASGLAFTMNILATE